jgi:beta propeller repeat protein
MKTNERKHSIALVSAALVFFLIFVLSTASAATVPTITETRITTNESAQLDPAIYENMIVWTDARNGIFDEYGNRKNLDIYMYDLSTSKETQITTNESNQSMPAIYGNRIVWQDDRNGNWDIYMYDLSTSKETQITTNESNQSMPAIYGNRIVWQDDRNGNWDIYMYDLSTSKETQITTDEFIQSNPAIYGDRIVWTDFRYGQNEGQSCIFMYDLSTHTETQITNGGSDHGSPAIYSDKMAYCNSEMSEIFVYDLSTHQETQITTNYSSSSPAIYGDRVVWHDSRNDKEIPINSDIYMYNLSTSQETQITTNDSEQFSPAIYGDRIVWGDTRNGYPKYDIYMCTISESEQTPIPPIANFSASTLSGISPLTVKFTSTSTGSPTSWKWSFGDGSPLVTEQNPEHTYSKAGIYTVKHTAINAYGRDTEIKTKYIKVTTPVKPVAAFSASPTSGKAPLTVKFTSTSTGSPTSWKWSFGDGSPLVTEQNPEHTYSKAGIYTVKHTAINAYGRDTEIKTKYIKVTTPVKPVAAFSASPTSGKAPLKVQFTDKSTGSPTSWKWSFGDKTYSTAKSPAHKYSKAGKYTVSLTVKNTAGTNTKTMSGYITVKK